jgi:hypothetical protein
MKNNEIDNLINFFEISVAVNIKIIFVWDVILHILLETYQCSGGI